MVTVQQDNGILTIEDPEGALVGGINADGSFSLGTVLSGQRDEGVTTGQLLELGRGQVVGSRMLVDFTIRTTFNAFTDRSGLADLQAVNVVVYERVE